MSSNYSFLNEAENKQCFCIDATNKDMPYILDHLKLKMQPHEYASAPTPGPAPTIDDNFDSFDYLITPQIQEAIHINPKDQQRLKAIDELMATALKKLDEPKDRVRPVNEKVDVAPRHSMTVHRHTDKVSKYPDASQEVDSDDDEIDLNTMARTTNKMQRRAGNLGLFEDFSNCSKYCTKNPIKLGLFEMDETKYVLLIIALLFMCSIVMRRK